MKNRPLASNYHRKHRIPHWHHEGHSFIKSTTAMTTDYLSATTTIIHQKIIVVKTASATTASKITTIVIIIASLSAITSGNLPLL